VLTLVEKSTDVELLSTLMKIVRGWIGGADSVAAVAAAAAAAAHDAAGVPTSQKTTATATATPMAVDGAPAAAS
jgi:hypothetical protein